MRNGQIIQLKDTKKNNPHRSLNSAGNFKLYIVSQARQIIRKGFSTKNNNHDNYQLIHCNSEIRFAMLGYTSKSEKYSYQYHFKQYHTPLTRGQVHPRQAASPHILTTHSRPQFKLLILSFKIHLTCISFNCGRKTVHPKNTVVVIEKTYKLQS